jgi:hypothetical protein
MGESLMDTEQIISLIRELPEADQTKADEIISLLIQNGLDPVVKDGTVYLWYKPNQPSYLSKLILQHDKHWYPSVPDDLEIADEAVHELEDLGFEVGIDDDLRTYIFLKRGGDRDVHLIRSDELAHSPTIAMSVTAMNGK